MKFYKGYAKTTGERVVAVIYDEPLPTLEFDALCRLTFVPDGCSKPFKTAEDMYNVVELNREICLEEYTYLSNLGKLCTEIWTNQYTGGFPNRKNSYNARSLLTV